MKIIKKITAMMLSIMMVLGMCSVVGAADAGTGETGSIKIKNAIVGQTYKIYKILELESYDKDQKLYSYKPVSNWKAFFDDKSEPKGAGSDYITVDDNGYARWTGEQTDERKREFAKLALKYAIDNNIQEDDSAQADAEEGVTTTALTFEPLPLGYYLVDSSAGALCSLDTTNSKVEIEEKNGVPSVEKKIELDGGTKGESNFANIGDTITFETKISVKEGAHNYVLHDTMSNGFELTQIQIGSSNQDIYIKIEDGANLIENTDYTFNKKSKNEFEVTFKDSFLKQHENEAYILVVRYNAILTGAASINIGNTNTTYLTYGDNKESNKSETTTVTYQIPVLKYTGDTTHPLANAKFKLYTSETSNTPIDLVQKNGTQDYRRALVGESGTITEITTDNTGKFNIQGFKPGVYWLEESAAPKGYNKLAKRIKVELKEDATLKINDKDKDGKLPISQVNVENKSGSLLPSTGGMGTTVFYIAGALLVLISGVVLIAKKRTDSK